MTRRTIYWQEGMHPTKNTATTQSLRKQDEGWEEQDTAATLRPLILLRWRTEEPENATELRRYIAYSLIFKKGPTGNDWQVYVVLGARSYNAMLLPRYLVWSYIYISMGGTWSWTASKRIDSLLIIYKKRKRDQAARASRRLRTNVPTMRWLVEGNEVYYGHWSYQDIERGSQGRYGIEAIGIVLPTYTYIKNDEADVWKLLRTMKF